jgi:Calcineurin-like phosphoesterase
MDIKKHIVALSLLPVFGGIAVLDVVAAEPPERLFLQQVSTHSAVVKWRGGDGASVCYSRKLKNLSKKNWPRCADGVVTDGGHMEARLTGLAPDKNYFYSVGGNIGSAQQFRTAPNANKPPKDGNTHILIVGDSGTQTELDDGELEHDGEAARALAGFEAYNAANGNEPVDIFLALGDNAYVSGTDEQWQGAFFEIYPDILKSAFTLPTIGNHEMGYGPLPLCALDPRVCGVVPPVIIPLAGVSTSADAASYDGNGDLQPDGTGMPYFDIFSLPTAAESGGVPSGTEQYYSVDYGNVHIVSLDSQLSARDPGQRAAMKEWLMADLAANNRDWTIVIFHHPPYSKGRNHDSDTADQRLDIDQPQWDMRNEFTPVFESYGVDVVYSGHAHSYERSFYLRGLTVTSGEMTALEDYVELNDEGQPALGYGDESYQQLSPTSGGVDDRVVYTVAGSSGKADSAPGGFDNPAEWLRHPAHLPQPADQLENGCGTDDGCHHGLAVLGNVVLDVSKNALTARFVDEFGEVLDQFTITR